MCASQQGKATDARAPSDIDRVSSRRRRITPQRQDQRLTWTRMIALTHTHTQRELLITTLIKWAAVAAPAKRVIMAGISFIGGLLWQICFSSPHFQSLPGGQGDEDPFFFSVPPSPTLWRPWTTAWSHAPRSRPIETRVCVHFIQPSFGASAMVCGQKTGKKDGKRPDVYTFVYSTSWWG